MNRTGLVLFVPSDAKLDQKTLGSRGRIDTEINTIDSQGIRGRCFGRTTRTPAAWAAGVLFSLTTIYRHERRRTRMHCDTGHRSTLPSRASLHSAE